MAIDANVINIRPTKKQVQVKIPDGSKIQSTHERDIDWPGLPASAKSAHIIPKLKQQSLLSIVKICKAGCKIIFQQKICIVLFNNKVLMYGTICPRTNLWLVPLKMQNWITKQNKKMTLTTQ